jgi:hypothetical protein
LAGCEYWCWELLTRLVASPKGARPGGARELSARLMLIEIILRNNYWDEAVMIDQIQLESGKLSGNDQLWSLYLFNYQIRWQWLTVREGLHE